MKISITLPDTITKEARFLSVFVLLCAAATRAQEIQIEGRVIGADGRGIAGARVELQPVLSRYDMGVREADGAGEMPPEAEAASGAAGRFTIAAPRAGMWTVTVRAAGCVPVRLRLLPLLEPVSLPDAVLRRDAGLRMRVEDAAGRPLPGARVSAEAAPRYTFAKFGPGTAEPSAWEPEPRRAVAGPDGEARLARWEGEALRVWAVDTGRAVREATAEDVPLAVIRLRKASPRRIAVREAGGAPPGIVVRDPRSGLVLGRMAPGRRRVSISRGAGRTVLLETADGRRLSLSRGSPAAILPRPAVRSGRVLDDGRQPLAGAWVWPEGEPGLAVRSDAQGVYRLENSALTDGLAAAAAGFLPCVHPPSKDLPTLFLTPAAAIAGTAVDEQEHPVAGAEVSITLLKNISVGWEPHPAWTSAAGELRIGGLMPGMEYEVAVRRPDFAPAIVSPVRPPVSGLRVVLRQGATATGQVMDEAGLPATGTVVELVLYGEGSVGRTAVAEDGSFSFPRLPPGQAELRIERAGAATLHRLGIDVPDGGTLDLGRILAPAGPSLAGRVTDPAGHPLSGVAVWLRTGAWDAWSAEPAATTGADGAFTVAGLPPGDSLEVDLCREGFYPVFKELSAPPPEPLSLTLRPALRLDGTVVDPEGQPVPHASLLASRRSEEADMEENVHRDLPCTTGPAATADAEGRFTLTPLKADPYMVFVSAEGFRQRMLEDIDIAPGPPRSLRIVLQRGAVLSGRVTDPQGRPVPGVRVYATPPSYDSDDLAITDAGGRYWMGGVEPGSVKALAVADGFKNTEQTVDVAAGGETSLDLVLSPEKPDEETDDTDRRHDGVLTGQIRGLEPAELTWARVEASCPQSVAREGGAASDGSYRLAGLISGEWTVTAWSGNRKVERTVRLDKDRPVATVDLDFPPVTAVAGRAFWQSGEPAAGAEIYFQKDPTELFPRTAAITRSDGTFDLRLEDGTYTITARFGWNLPDVIAKPVVVAGAPVSGLEITLEGEPGEAVP